MHLLDIGNHIEFQLLWHSRNYFPNSTSQSSILRRRHWKPYTFFLKSPRTWTSKAMHTGFDFSGDLSDKQTKLEYRISIDKEHQIVLE